MSYKNLLHILIFLVASAIVIIVSVHLGFIIYFNDKIKHRLEEEINRQTDGRYEAQIEKLSVNIFAQSIHIKVFVLKNLKEHDSPSIFASAGEINFLEFQIIPLLLRKELKISKVELINSSGYIYRPAIKDMTILEKEKKKFSFYNLISKFVSSLDIKEINISDSDIRIFNDKTGSVPFIASKNNQLRISNLQINKSTEASGRLFVTDSLNVEINRISYTTPDKLYSVLIKRLAASHTSSGLILDSVELVPKYSKKEFASRAGHQTDRFVISAERAVFKRMSVKSFFERNWFIAAKLEVTGLNVSAYRDKNDLRKPGRAGSLQKLIRNIPFYTRIDTVQVKNAKIIYEEVAPKSNRPGKVYFTHAGATITGVTNDTSLYSKYDFLKVNASGRLMNEGKLSVFFRFPLDTEGMIFSCSGRLSEFPLAAINPILEPNARASIKAGAIDSMIFSFNAGEIASKGKMKFFYHNLKLELMNKNNEQGIVQSIMSFLTHQFIIKEENPSGRKPPRITEINYPRDPTRFIFNYSWKSMLSGIAPAIGIPDRVIKKKKGKNNKE